MHVSLNIDHTGRPCTSPSLSGLLREKKQDLCRTRSLKQSACGKSLAVDIRKPIASGI
jgi:hypothetical protein